jgi:HTH-type transcriptional regulator, sugar sensing transcriptional regulator
MTVRPECTESLTELGFTELEARIYICLLQSSPATGYKVAQEIGATNASTYKALESLQTKGAVLVDDARRRLCRAVPFEELFEQMERRFRERRDRAAGELRELRVAGGDDRIYQLKNADQVYAKCRSMLRSSRKLLLVDIFPEPLAVLSDAIREAARSGPERMLVQVYEPADLEGVDVIEHWKGPVVLERWPVHWVSLMSDGLESLVAAFEPDGKTVHQALWTASPVFSWAFLAYADCEFLLASLTSALDKAQSLDDVKHVIESWRGLSGSGDSESVPGRKVLMERFSNRPCPPGDR